MLCRVMKLAVLGLVAGLTTACVQARNIRSYELYTGSPEHKKNWTVAQAKAAISGTTYLRHSPNVGNEALYFEPGNVVYQWISGRPTVLSSTWFVQEEKNSRGEWIVVCTNLPPLRGTARMRCIDTSLLYIPAVSSTRGDAFGLAGRKEAPGELSLERMRVQDAAAIARGGA